MAGFTVLRATAVVVSVAVTASIAHLIVLEPSGLSTVVPWLFAMTRSVHFGLSAQPCVCTRMGYQDELSCSDAAEFYP
jgi:hypothetical protein